MCNACIMCMMCVCVNGSGCVNLWLLHISGWHLVWGNVLAESVHFTWSWHSPLIFGSAAYEGGDKRDVWLKYSKKWKFSYICWTVVVIEQTCYCTFRHKWTEAMSSIGNHNSCIGVHFIITCFCTKSFLVFSSCLFFFFSSIKRFSLLCR